MSIVWNEQMQTITLHTENSTYQMKIDKYKVLLHTYYGKRLEEEMDMSYLISYLDRGFSGNPYEAGNYRKYSVDTIPQEYSTYGAGDFRTSACKINYSDGSFTTSLIYESHEIIKGKYGLTNLPVVYCNETEAQTLKVKLKEKARNVYVYLYYGVMEKQDVITRAIQIVNEDDPVYLENVMSSCLDFIGENYDLITFCGKYSLEREFSREKIRYGRQSVGSNRGMSSHNYNPFVIICDRETTEDYGNCYGEMLLYSGDFLAETERDHLEQYRHIIGINSGNFRYKLEKGESFYAPEVVLAYSSVGLAKLTHIYHNIIHKHIVRGKFKTESRPILINSWEGVYFTFTGEKLLQMAREAASLGIELFVMDDGWFGKRDNDLSGLGDWRVNEEKLGCTLKELAETICGMGMKFGIWVEPESVNEDSDLYREHPDWAIKVPGREPMRSRYQLVLDFSRREVREHIYSMICSILDSAAISYVKWDFNRSITDIYSAQLPSDRQGEVAYRYILGLYEMLEKITTAYPEVLFEGCSGGGGRFDAGMLYYTPQIWCSDNTDAIDRLRIQYGTMFCYPASTMGAHVATVPNHQTGRVTPLNTRAVVAMAGTFGYELDVNKLSKEDKEIIKEQIADFKEIKMLIQNGEYYRLASPYDGNPVSAWEFVDSSQDEVLVCVVSNYSAANSASTYIKLKGLQNNAWYRLKTKFHDFNVETQDNFEFQQLHQKEDESEMRFLGSALMQGGIPIPYPKEEYQAWNFHFIKLD